MHDEFVLVTGSHGLVGKAVAQLLLRTGNRVLFADLRSDTPFDICDQEKVETAASQVTGIIHLGAVSRVVEAERHPALCQSVNVDATRHILQSALKSRLKPWVIYASSREVYGPQPGKLVNEDIALAPINIYGRSKHEAENLVTEARRAGLKTAIVRFSSVYGALNDHADRVMPAFVGAAVTGGTLRLDGPNCAFDFTHIDDVAPGVAAVASQLFAGEQRLPPIHFVSGRSTSLEELANRAIAAGNGRGRFVIAPPRSFDVHEFVGDPGRAKALLGWQATVTLEAGLSRYADLMRTRLPVEQAEA
ncbi:NAD(P)-dependent oxidoreductase [Mesorhizobium sp. M7A.T.Ca.TU.009.01.3.2]|nr:NAD(P)-dependent oxidoreductase [Mesorhizobium sp. M7A.T.Ca.TU.009.01.3.2]RUV08875.1 NAD(P)-dependent oxidoreductase [Mesorhizobium sp. M7A.T.Ca.TU.009.01.3.1]